MDYDFFGVEIALSLGDGAASEDNARGGVTSMVSLVEMFTE